MVRNGYRKGFNLVEMAIVMAVISLVVSGIWYGLTQYKSQKSGADFSQKLVMIQSAIENLFPVHGIDSDVTMASLISLGVFPGDMVVNGKVFTPWGEELTLGGVAPDGETIGFNVDWQGDASVCIGISQALASAGFVGFVDSMNAGADPQGGQIGSANDFAGSSNYCEQSSQHTINREMSFVIPRRTN